MANGNMRFLIISSSLNYKRALNPSHEPRKRCVNSIPYHGGGFDNQQGTVSLRSGTFSIGPVGDSPLPTGPRLQRATPFSAACKVATGARLLWVQTALAQEAEKGSDAEAADRGSAGEDCASTRKERAQAMKKELLVQLHFSFEQCMQTETEGGTTFWLARDLQTLLGYAQWRNFEQVIGKAKTACANSGYDVADHFADVSKMVDVGSGAQREQVDKLEGPTEDAESGGSA